MDADPLDLFLPPVRAWFRAVLGEPTPPQRLGWPGIVAGQSTLILAPTGSGKTLAAFLACLDWLWRQGPLAPGVRVLYVSPLKALNNDISRNLRLPLEGIVDTARQLGTPLPDLDVAVRTGDTSTAERQRQARRPPHILITTPESLHLLLTSRARETLRGVRFCIVDEIHALCTNKRGVFLALLLERLEALNVERNSFRSANGERNEFRSTPGLVRIGLSATQRPLAEVARFLGGSTLDSDGRLVERPVTIVDAGLRKDLDLLVVNPVEQFGPLPERSIWPSIYRLLGDEIRQHRSTLVFANDRRSVERITSFLNVDQEIARAHHGSVDLARRQEIETALKDGRLPAVVATASLEMGIDMGAVDLVCQVASPGSVARALQRVGRAGHLVGQRSKGRLIPKTLPDLLEMAVLAREMAAGRVEESRVPTNCLDVLAQQVVALASLEPWSVPELFALVRRAYPYRDLSPQAFETTLEMISGRYRFERITPQESTQRGTLNHPNERSESSVSAVAIMGAEEGSAPASSGGRNTLDALQGRVSWDRVHNRLLPLPGSQQMALVNGGTIPDTGQYAAYAGAVRVGELDEEFVYERRIGDSFLLGTNAWRIDRIEADRVQVLPAEGAPAMVPFWRGEGGGRSFELGQAIGAFLRELTARLDDEDRLDWLRREFHLDQNAARNLCFHVTRQLLAAGCLPTDQTLLIEASRDQLGDWQVLLLSPLGHRLHLSLRLALEASLRRRLGYRPQCLHHDDGILVRLTDSAEPVLDLLAGLTPDNVEGLILEELADSALFALRFRQNAARALLLPRSQPGRRAPLWLQRLRGRDLLQVCRRHPDFPVVVETFRECLQDHLDLPRLRTLLQDIRSGRMGVTTRRAEVPSPFAAGLLFSFTAAFLYQQDRVEAEPGKADQLDRGLLEQLIAPERQAHLLDPRAVTQVERRLRNVGLPPRTATELAEWLRRLGDLAPSDLEGPMAVFLEELEADGRALRLNLPNVREPLRWVSAEEIEVYRLAFGLIAEPVERNSFRSAPAGRERNEFRSTGSAVNPSTQAQQAGATILGRFLDTHALVGLVDILTRYPFEADWARRQLEAWSQTGRAVPVRRGEAGPLEWSAPDNLDRVQRGSLALLRREVTTCTPPQFVDFVLRWQYAHPAERRGGDSGVAEVLSRLEGLPLPRESWEANVLPLRVPGYQPRWLDAWVAGGGGVAVASGANHLAFYGRATVRQLARVEPPDTPALDDVANNVLERLRSSGAAFVTDLAVDLRLTPGVVRTALGELLRRGLVTNDQFEVLRRGEEEPLVAPTDTIAPGALARARLPSLRTLRRGAESRPDGRWSVLPWGHPTPEEQVVFQAGLLLQRYGVAARELALLDPGLPPWRLLYEVLSRLELAGEVRRGYFVEGLSGAQFALPEVTERLNDVHLPSTATAPAVLLHSQDPANLYGSGAPFDIALLDGGTRPLLRRPGNWLVLRAGRPVLLAEQGGLRLTALTSASRDDLTAAAACLPALATVDGRGTANRHKLTVEEWNGEPVTTTVGREYLEAVGFVRDYQALTLYAAFR